LRNQYAAGAPVFASIMELLVQTAPEIVLICTPTSEHFDQVAACQQLGTHVLCEKPLADSRDRIDRLIDAAENGPALHAIAYQRRSWATYRALRWEVLSGRWGPVRSVTMRATEDWQSTIGGTWRDDPQANLGGFIGDAGSHKIDAVFFVTELAPREVYARSWNCGSQVDVVTLVSAVLDGDVPLNMDFIGNAGALREDLHVHCEEADLMIRDGRAWIARTNQVEPIAPLEPDTNPIAAFLDALDGTAENRAPFRCARPVFDFTTAIMESAAAGHCVVLTDEYRQPLRR
ncbi:MAG: Gfo/Idh/MocA family oxidoreductase, partial [Pirellulales bacterium]